MKQTAVEWFAKQVLRSGQLGFISNEKFNELFHQAKAMEKEQIMDAFKLGNHTEMRGGKFIDVFTEDYYNETFKSE